ncbi:endogenous retrovirus group K member 10 Gag polyprotein-like [Talpa occidentalis]|uniref:endogenous retrovirus group K member 10 Gag polyprotein-like n=1 Tax=Talpa occidentalis TaxID=50954 RepID=UPI00188FD617|nr:endogenous retrovirus group K member 10 Gag polyprotein-like [Talpa occidentalis]
MGQALSEHQLYVSQLKEALRTRGVRVKSKDLFLFFDFVQETCPWFPKEGTIDEKRWQRVGDAVNEFYQVFGPEKFPVTAFSYWNLINDLLAKQKTDPGLQHAISHTENILKSAPSSVAETPSSRACGEDLISSHSEDEEISPPKHATGVPNPCDETNPQSNVPPVPDGAPQPAGTPVKEPRPNTLPPCKSLYPSLPRPRRRSPSASEVDWDELAEQEVVETTNAQGVVQRHHEPHNFRNVKELKEAVSLYGATAPFTLTVLDTLAQSSLTPSDWYSLAKATLSGGDHLLWKAEFIDNCKVFERQNREARNGWTLEMLIGEGNYSDQNNQINFPPGLYAQISVAALSARRKLPSKNNTGTPLIKIRQASREPYSDFVDRLQTAAERMLGDTAGSSDFVRQLAFENASPACQAAICPIRRTTSTIMDYVRACADIDPAYQQGLAMAAAFSGQTVAAYVSGQTQAQVTCFKCKKQGHFARNCPSPASPAVSRLSPFPFTNQQPQTTATTTSASSRPSQLCPRCRRGYHWARECRSLTDSDGNPLPPPFGKLQAGPAPGPATNNGVRSIDDQSHPDKWPTSRATSGSARLDLCAATATLLTPEMVPQVLSTTSKGPPPVGTYGLLLGRFSLNLRGLHVFPGIIDQDFTGTLSVVASTSLPLQIRQGQKIAQLVPLPLLSGRDNKPFLIEGRALMSQMSFGFSP